MLSVTPYTPELQPLWDKFVCNESFNGTFLQTQGFLGYHPVGKYEDASFLIHKEDDIHDIYAVVPACTYMEHGKRVLHSHAGSTFGGVVASTLRYTIKNMVEVIEVLDSHLAKNFDRVILKNTAQLFSTDSNDLLEYLLWKQGYRPYVELSTYIDFTSKQEPIQQYFDLNKRRNVKKLEKNDFTFRRLHSASEIETFHEVLANNLAKYNVSPIHTKEEMVSFETQLLSDIVQFYGLYDGDTMVAGGMCFAFHRTKTFHTQNLSSRQDIGINVSTYLYYRVIRAAFEQGFNNLSFGISTEQHGQHLNLPLAQSKEGYGGQHTVLKTYEKSF